MKTDIWMPLYIKDLLADTLHLNTRQFGAYMFLLCHYWEKGLLQACYMQTISRLSDGDFGQDKQILMQFFSEKEGLLINKRLEEELIKSRENKEKYSNRARHAAQKRYSAKSNASSNSQAMLQACTKIGEGDDKGKDKVLSFKKEFLEFYKLYPNKKAKPDAEKAFIRARERGVSFETIMQGLDQYKTANHFEGYKWAHPSTWLNQGRWEDDYSEEKKKSKFRELMEGNENV